MKFDKLWKIVTVGIAAIAASMLAAAVYAQDLPFKPGEKITYDLVGQIKEWRMKGTLGNMEIALVGYELFKGKRLLHAHATISSSLLLKTRYELKDVFHSWFDPKTFQTYRVEKIIQEGTYTNHVIYEIDPQTGTVTEHNRNVQKVRNYTRPDKAYDFVSFLYWLRTAKKDQTFTFTLFDGEWKNQFTVAMTPGDDVSIPLLDKKNKLKTLVIKQSKPYDLTFKFAKDFSYIPIEISVVNVQAGNVHVTARSILSGYKPGK
jgi:hypothetical protein